MFLWLLFHTVVRAVVRKQILGGVKNSNGSIEKYDTTIFRLYSKAADTQWFVKRLLKKIEGGDLLLHQFPTADCRLA